MKERRMHNEIGFEKDGKVIKNKDAENLLNEIREEFRPVSMFFVTKYEELIAKYFQNLKEGDREEFVIKASTILQTPAITLSESALYFAFDNMPKDMAFQFLEQFQIALNQAATCLKNSIEETKKMNRG